MGLFSSGDGYGEADRKMAAQLRDARSQEEADRIAQDNGLKNARDAQKWLKERS